MLRRNAPHLALVPTTPCRHPGSGQAAQAHLPALLSDDPRAALCGHALTPAVIRCRAGCGASWHLLHRRLRHALTGDGQAHGRAAICGHTPQQRGALQAQRLPGGARVLWCQDSAFDVACQLTCLSFPVSFASTATNMRTLPLSPPSSLNRHVLQWRYREFKGITHEACQQELPQGLDMRFRSGPCCVPACRLLAQLACPRNSVRPRCSSALKCLHFPT